MTTHAAKPLSTLLAAIPDGQVYGATDVPITTIAYDSRKVQPGGLFVAIKGYHSDGHAYISQARQRGAVAVVVDMRYVDINTCQGMGTVIGVANSRAVLAPLAAAFYSYPARRLGVVGITGTKGKSTTTAWTSHILERGGYTTGFISTVDFKIGPRQWSNALRQSTPEALEIQTFLHDMGEAGCDYAVLESSSHGLSAAWNRLGHCAFDVAVLTNVTHEHLDYHGSVEQYRRDKARLFAMLAEEEPAAPAPPAATTGKYAIVNADDPHHQMFLDAAPPAAHRLTYALHRPADVRAHAIEHTPTGSRGRVTTPWGDSAFALHVPGPFNLSNALAALSVALSQGVPLAVATDALSSIGGVRGRMERVAQGQPFEVLVDYAHNPDSFEQLMAMLRPLTPGCMIAVFGSAGERDTEKRPLQGAIAARYCELLILTDEDPRGEDREAILADIAAGAEQAGARRGQGYLIIPDRAAALRAACARAAPGDLVLLLGKGHEGSIEYAHGKQPWDEVAEARAALRDSGYG